MGKYGVAGRRRANKTGTIERRGGRFLARWYYYDELGQRKRQSKLLEATNLADAKTELADLTEGNALIKRERLLERAKTQLEGVRAERAAWEAAQPALALDALWDAFSSAPERPQCGAETLSRYRAQVSRFVDWAKVAKPDVVEMRQVDRGVVSAFLADLATRVSANSYNKIVVLMRLVWRVVGTVGRCVGNPWEGVKKKTLENHGRRALTVDELRRVCSGLEGETRVLFALGIYTGLRLGDCCRLEWGAVDMDRQIIVTTPAKTKRHKSIVEIPIHPALFAVLDETASGKRRGAILPEYAALYRRDSSAVSDRVQRVFERAKIETQAEVDGYAQKVPIVGFHSLRHTFVSLMGNAGAPLALVQSIVGHANPMMTAHYFHAQTDALRSAVGALPALEGEDDGKAAKRGPSEALARVLRDVESLSPAELRKVQKAVKARLTRTARGR